MSDSSGMEIVVFVGAIGAAIVMVAALLRWIVTNTNIGARDRPEDPEELVTVAEFPNALEAELWRGRLNAAGVRCTLAGDTSLTHVRYVELNRGVRLQVMAKDAQRALAVLEAR